ncbi:MAG: FAD-binding oxidoreductase [Cyanobacteriota bacterium]|jgi:glycolate oxidase FAD binding subunit
MSTTQAPSLPSHWTPWLQVEPTLRECLGVSSVPQAVFLPNTEGELAEAVADCAQHQRRILPWGSGSKLRWGGLVNSADLALGTGKLNQVLDYAQADLTITVGAGMKLAELQAFLAPARQFLPLDPLYPEQSTLGGIMATADAGSWRHRYGGVRDLVLGFSFARWDGPVAKAGSKVVKNVAGYDLMKLFTGAYGTLGVVTQLTLRLYPQPSHSVTLLLTGGAEKLEILIAQILGSGLSPTALDLLTPSVLENLESGEGLGLLARFQSVAESVAAQKALLQGWAGELALTCQVWESAEEQELWRHLLQSFSAPLAPQAALCKVGLPANQAVRYLENCPHWGQIHLGSGLGRLRLATASAPELLELRRRAEAAGGFLTLLDGADALKTQVEPWGYTGDAGALMAALKRQFDPQMIFNPGRLGALN